MTAVVLAHGAEPYLTRCVESLLVSEGVRVRVVVVDNDARAEDLAPLEGRDRVRLLRPGRNLGYAEGCNTGAAATTDDVLVFVNSDCWVQPTALAALTCQVLRHGGLATSSLRLAEAPDLLNSAGNPVHYLGFSWAGRLGQPAAAAQERTEVASISGACFAVSTSLWAELGGFPAEYFAYHEDVALSLLCRLAGHPVTFVPQAEAHHAYEFSRNSAKLFLLERNRLLTWLTVWRPRTLALLLPALLAGEAGTAVLAARQGWLREKLRAWWWLASHAGQVRARRRAVAARRQVPDREVAAVLTGSFAGSPTEVSAVPPLVDRALAGYWALVRRWL